MTAGNKQKEGGRIVEYREVAETLSDIKETIWPKAKVVGFSFTVRNEHSTLNIKWGDVAMRKYRSPAIKYVKARLKSKQATKGHRAHRRTRKKREMRAHDR